MPGKPPKKPEDRDSTAREVDRLLRQLPGADPSLQSDPDQPPPRPQAPATGTQRPMGASPPPPPMRPRPTASKPLGLWGMWGRVAAGVVLGVALTQWPYRSACGWSLYGHVAAVAVLLVVAGWAALGAWQLHNGPAHAIALIVGFWGIVLAAEQILPRVGYAAEARTWTCQAAPVPTARPVAPVVPAVPVDSLADTAATTDTTATTDTASPTDTTTGGP